MVPEPSAVPQGFTTAQGLPGGEAVRQEDVRILALVSSRADAEHLDRVLRHAGLILAPCPDMETLCERLHQGAGAVLLVQEALTARRVEQFAAVLASQPTWSDLPVLLFGSLADDRANAMQKVARLQALGNVTVLERPVQVAGLLIAAHNALRIRQRQYQTRDHLARIEAIDAELRNAHAAFERMADTIPHLVWATAPDGRGHYFNRRWYDYTGMSAAGATTWQDALHPLDRPAADAWWQAALTSGMGGPHEARLRGHDGAFRLHSLRTEAVRAPTGEIERWVGSGTDIHDERRMLEQLRESQKLDALGRLAGGVAHEFNNLLTAIQGFNALTQDQIPPDSPAQGNLQEVDKACVRAASLTQQLLAYGRRQLLATKSFPLQSALDEGSRLLERLLGERVTLALDPGDDVVWVRMDPGQLQQVVVNLVVNARDALPDGGTIRLRASRVDVGPGGLGLEPPCVVPDPVPSGSYACLEVEDEGSGMDPAVLARAFEPFFTTKGVGRGTGLGLSTVYGIVRQSHGFLTMTSRRGVGTVVQVLLPIVLPAPESTEAQPSLRQGLQPPPQAYTVLLVEDEDAVRRILSDSLVAVGYRVLRAANGEEALKLAARQPHPIDVLVSDVVMPRMSGPELAEQIVKRYGDIPVVLMSGYADDERLLVDRRQSDAFLHKPFTPRHLDAVLRRVLANRPVRPGPHAATPPP